MNKDISRPIILEIEDTKNELFATINNAIGKKGIPCYFLEPILLELYSQVKSQSKNELDIIRANHEQTKINRRNGK